MNQLFQVPFPFVTTPKFTHDGFVVGETNQQAFTWINNWPCWPASYVNIYGPSGVGKTHLASIWQQLSDAYVIDLVGEELNVEPSAIAQLSKTFIVENIGSLIKNEEWFFHFYNAAKLYEGSLLFVSTIPLQQMQIQLPDLKSRFSTFIQIPVHTPDDHLLAGVFNKMAMDRGITLTDEITNYILNRIDRSFESLQGFIKRIDDESLSQQKSLTIPFLRQMFKE